MVTAKVKEGNGASPTYTEVSTITFCTNDTYNPGSNYPCHIPTAGYHYSYWKTLCLEFQGIGTKVTNIKFFTEGELPWQLGDGGGLFIGTKNSGDSGIDPYDDYDQARGTVGITGYAMDDAQNGHAIYKQEGYSVVNALNYTAENPLDVQSTDITQDGKSLAIVLQLKLNTLASGAQTGYKSGVVLTFRWDEI